MRRLLIPLIVLLAVIAAVAASAFSVPSTAATVNGSTITRSQLAGDLSAISGSTSYECFLNASIALRTSGSGQLPSVEGVGGSGTGNTQFVDFWLSQLVNDRLIEQLAAGHHLTISSADLAAGRNDLLQSMNATLSTVAADKGQQAICAPSAQSVLDSMPASFVAARVRAQAAGDVLLAAAAGYSLSSASISQYFDSHTSDFDTLCVTAVQTADQATASQLRAKVVAGTPLSQLAPTSTSTMSAAQSVCFAASSLSYSAVAGDLKGIAVGGVTQPLSNSSGSYLLLQLDKRTPATFSQVETAVREAVLASGDKRASAELSSATKSASVTLDPRYGTWVSATSLTINPPASPPLDTVLSASANQAP